MDKVSLFHIISGFSTTPSSQSEERYIMSTSFFRLCLNCPFRIEMRVKGSRYSIFSKSYSKYVKRITLCLQIAGAFMAPISQLHGLGVEEFSQTGPTDHITAIVNRTKTNVVSRCFSSIL